MHFDAIYVLPWLHCAQCRKQDMLQYITVVRVHIHTQICISVHKLVLTSIFEAKLINTECFSHVGIFVNCIQNN